MAEFIELHDESRAARGQCQSQKVSITLKIASRRFAHVERSMRGRHSCQGLWRLKHHHHLHLFFLPTISNHASLYCETESFANLIQLVTERNKIAGNFARVQKTETTKHKRNCCKEIASLTRRLLDPELEWEFEFVCT